MHGYGSLNIPQVFYIIVYAVLLLHDAAKDRVTAGIAYWACSFLQGSHNWKIP
jgi:hypothetical protein